MKKVKKLILHKAFSKKELIDKKIATEAVKDFGANLSKLPKIHQDNKEIVTEAIKDNPYAIMFASERLKKDADIQKVAVAESHTTSKFCTDLVDEINIDKLTQADMDLINLRYELIDKDEKEKDDHSR